MQTGNKIPQKLYVQLHTQIINDNAVDVRDKGMFHTAATKPTDTVSSNLYSDFEKLRT